MVSLNAVAVYSCYVAETTIMRGRRKQRPDGPLISHNGAKCFPEKMHHLD